MTTRCLGGLALLFLAAPAVAQTAPSLGTVVADGVTVRGSPRDDGPDTGTLPRGATVVVHHAEGDKWLAIQPPRGSVSWVNHKFLKLGKPTENTFPQNAVVTADGPVKLAVGRQGVDRPLDVRQATVPDGTILMVIGPKVASADDGTDSFWYPVEPPADDFRYVPKDAVSLTGPAKESFVVRSPSPAPGRADPGPASIPNPGAGKPAGWPSHPLWTKAEAAEQAGDLDAAERLYFQLAREMNAAGGDADLANLCYTRVHALRERRRQAPGSDRGISWATAPDRAPAEKLAPRREEPPRRTEAAAPPPTSGGQWTGAGHLRPAAFRVNGKPAFALEDSRGRAIMYAVASAGVDLDRHSRRTVDLYGTVQYVGELRGVGLMTVTKVDPAK